MRVLLACSPLSGLSGAEVAELARTAWLTQRPADRITAYPVSDGVSVPFVGSGLPEALLKEPTEYPLGRGDSRRFAFRAGDTVVLDYSQFLDDAPATGALQSSTAVGEDLLWARANGAKRIVVALPAPGYCTDMGLGMLASLADARLPSGWTATDPVPFALTPVLERASQVLSDVDLVVLASGEQRLLGFSGVARTWAYRGMDPERAQEFSRGMGAVAQDVAEAAAARANTRPLLPLHGEQKTDRPERGPFSGAGSGVGFILDFLGGRLMPVGRATVSERLREEARHTDLFVYVCAAIGESIPSGLQAAIELASAAAVPIVVIYDSGSLRRGELPRLGLDGAYELRPEEAWQGVDRQRECAESEDDVAAAGTRAKLPGDEVQERLLSVTGRVARTWGWDA